MKRFEYSLTTTSEKKLSWILLGTKIFFEWHSCMMRPILSLVRMLFLNLHDKCDLATKNLF